MLKLIGLICIVLCGAGCGNTAAVKLHRQCVFCGALRMFLNELGIRMRWSGETLEVLIVQLREQKRFAPLGFLRQFSIEEDETFSDAWSRSIMQEHALMPEVQSLLQSVGETLGTSDIEGQMQTLVQHDRRLEELYENAREQERTKARLYRSLGLLFGMTAALLLC